MKLTLTVSKKEYVDDIVEGREQPEKKLVTSTALVIIQGDPAIAKQIDDFLRKTFIVL
jgi:hypothetical protein